MTKITRKLTVFLILLFALVLLASAIPAGAEGGAQQRPIEDFVNRQGTFCISGDGVYEDPCPPDSFLVVPPVANFIGWSDPKTGLLASMDYAGLADACAGGAFGTEMKGHITERPLADGRAEVHVTLHTSNALTFVTQEDFFSGPLLFGQRLEGFGECGRLPLNTQAALGSSLLHVSFINTAPGALLPDLIQLIYFTGPDQEVLRLGFQGQADGLLADGTPGRVKVTQTGLFMTSGMGATADGFPAENIILRAVGQ